MLQDIVTSLRVLKNFGQYLWADSKSIDKTFWSIPVFIQIYIYFFKLRAFARTLRLCGYVLAAEKLCIVYQCPALIIVHVVNKNLFASLWLYLLEKDGVASSGAIP